MNVTHPSQVLGQFFDRHEEVPVVAMYRKELAGPLLALAPDDAPAVTSRDEYDRQRGQRHKKHYDQVRGWGSWVGGCGGVVGGGFGVAGWGGGRGEKASAEGCTQAAPRPD